MIRQRISQFFSSDRLNPVLLKELRQAVQSPLFVGVLVVVQLLMILFVTFGMAAATGAHDVKQNSVFFWGLVNVYLLFVLPLMGFNALPPEYKEGRIDLLRITTITPRKLILGKWFSLNIQGWLVISSLLPYLTLRYFTGAINPVAELMTMLTSLYGSLIISGLTISASSAHSWWGRIFFFGFAGFGLLIFSGISISLATALISAFLPAYFMIFIVPPIQLFALSVIFSSASSIVNKRTVEPQPLFEPVPLSPA